MLRFFFIALLVISVPALASPQSETPPEKSALEIPSESSPEGATTAEDSYETPEAEPANDQLSAQNETSENEVETGEEAKAVSPFGEIVISASRAKEEPFFSDRSIGVITGKGIAERAPRTVPEALRETPGVFVQHTNHGGGSPIIRGLVGPQVLILVDGIRLNNSVFRTGPLQYLNFLDPYNVDRLEIVRGPGSVLYGSDALGGVINAVTIKPGDRRFKKGAGVNGRAFAKFGSANMEKTGHLLLDVGYDWFGANAVVTYKNFEDLKGGGSVGEQPYTAYDQLNASGKIIIRPSDGMMKDCRFALGYSLSRMFDVGRAEKIIALNNTPNWAEELDVSPSFNKYNNSHDLVYGKAHFRLKMIKTSVDVTFSHQRLFEEKNTIKLNDARSLELENERDRITVNTIGGEAQFTTRLLSDKLRFIYGIEFSQDEVDSSRRKKDIDSNMEWLPGNETPFPNGSIYHLFGAYLLSRGEIFPGDWDFGLRLTAGYRIQEIGGGADKRADAPEINYSSISHVFMAGVQGSYRDKVMTAFTWSQGFRAPNLKESVYVGDTGDYYHIANDDLGPERSDTFEWLARFNVWNFSGSASAYLTLLSDIIDRQDATHNGKTEWMGKNVVKNANIGEGLIYGAEGSLSYKIGWGLSMHCSMAYTYGEVKQANGEFAPYSKIPPLFGMGKFRWESETSGDYQGFAEAYTFFASKQDRLSPKDKEDPRIPKGGTPGWATLNLRGGLDLFDHFRMSLTLENLTDEKYKYHASGVYSAGRSVISSVEGRF